jgi:chromosome partitioning related protein ParA
MGTKTLAVLATKGGVGKSTIAVNLAATLADAGLTVLLLDFDIQPTASSYFPLIREARGGILELLASDETRSEEIISQTVIPRLDVIVSNDKRDQLPNHLLYAARGRFKLRKLLPKIDPPYDVIIIDTRGTQSLTVETALLASNHALSPVNAEILVAREFRRGTIHILDELAEFEEFNIQLPVIQAFLNRLKNTTDSKLIAAHLRETFADEPRVSILNTPVFESVAFRKAAMFSEAAHRFEPTRPAHRKMPAALQTMKDLASEIFPTWADKIAALTPASFALRETP